MFSSPSSPALKCKHPPFVPPSKASVIAVMHSHPLLTLDVTHWECVCVPKCVFVCTCLSSPLLLSSQLASDQSAVTLCKWSWYGFVFAFCLHFYKMISMFHGAPVIIIPLTHIDGPQIHILALFSVTRKHTQRKVNHERTGVVAKHTCFRSSCLRSGLVVSVECKLYVVWFELNVGHCCCRRLCATITTPAQPHAPNPDYRVQERWGLTWINKGLMWPALHT